MAESLLLAIGLVLILEGLMPMLAPQQWRTLASRIAQFRDGQLRFIGMCAVLVGLLLISI
ncbi:MAG: DUF2065 family protein [Quisquiliibacterium sp.]